MSRQTINAIETGRYLPSLPLAIALATSTVFWVADGFEADLAVGLALLAFTALVHFGRRHSGTLEVMSGTASCSAGRSSRGTRSSPS